MWKKWQKKTKKNNFGLKKEEGRDKIFEKIISHKTVCLVSTLLVSETFPTLACEVKFLSFVIVISRSQRLSKRWNQDKVQLIITFFLQEHTGRVFRLQFDEFQIVSSSHDDTILIWDFLNYNQDNPESPSTRNGGGNAALNGSGDAGGRSPSRKLSIN